jgi:dihydrolipoamide dehydrogenase
MDDAKKHDLVIIGAGPGGYRAAFMAADLGLNVTLIDPEKNPGGVCLYRGCIPTKALLYLTSIIKEADEAGELGIKFSAPEIDVKKAARWKDKVVKRLTGGLGQLVKARKINYIRGRARFLDNNTLEIKAENGDAEKISFKNVIIATGASANKLPGADYSSPSIMNSEEALEFTDIPDKLLIVGGGYIGIEMAIIYHEFGSKVSIAELTDSFYLKWIPTWLPSIKRQVRKFMKMFLWKHRSIKLKRKINCLLSLLRIKKVKHLRRLTIKCLLPLEKAQYQKPRT